MAFQKLMERTGFFSTKENKSDEDLLKAVTPIETQSTPLAVTETSPLSMNVDLVASASISTPVPFTAAPNRLKRGATPDWLANHPDWPVDGINAGRQRMA